mgnify:CR=1 FL=1
MELRLKILIFAVVPLALALAAIAFTVRYHTLSLAQKQQTVIKPAYLATKDAELKSYVAIAKRAIAHLYDSGKTDEATKREARVILEKLEYGKDGYFFVYDHRATMIVHPRMRESVGKNMWDFKDPSGRFLIRELIRVSQNENGGFKNYVWEKYSTGSSEPKPAAQRTIISGAFEIGERTLRQVLVPRRDGAAPTLRVSSPTPACVLLPSGPGDSLSA